MSVKKNALQTTLLVPSDEKSLNPMFFCYRLLDVFCWGEVLSISLCYKAKVKKLIYIRTLLPLATGSNIILASPFAFATAL